jgi:hypothetical protein
MFWITLLAYELVWLAAVVGAGHGHVWPGVAAAGAFAGWRLAASRRRRIELLLVAVTVALALVLEGLWVSSGLIAYSAPWPFPEAPAWLIALWVAFALTLVPLFGYLHGRPKLAAWIGAVGGPLAYAGAARGHALRFAAPLWGSLAAVSLGWAIALPLLTGLAARALREGAAGEAR